jgi:hypothetical protein
MGDRKAPSPPPGEPGYQGPANQVRPVPPPPPPPKRFDRELSTTQKLTADDPVLETLIADVEQRTALKLRIANAEGEGPFVGESASDVARRIVADCKDRQGVFYEEGLLNSISEIVVMLFRAQGRLPLFKNIITGEISDR